jgi:hypothetical protein
LTHAVDDPRWRHHEYRDGPRSAQLVPQSLGYRPQEGFGRHHPTGKSGRDAQCSVRKKNADAAKSWTPPDFTKWLEEDFGGKIMPLSYADFLER